MFVRWSVHVLFSSTMKPNWTKLIPSDPGILQFQPYPKTPLPVWLIRITDYGSSAQEFDSCHRFPFFLPTKFFFADSPIRTYVHTATGTRRHLFFLPSSLIQFKRPGQAKWGRSISKSIYSLNWTASRSRGCKVSNQQTADKPRKPARKVMAPLCSWLLILGFDSDWNSSSPNNFATFRA